MRIARILANQEDFIKYCKSFQENEYIQVRHNAQPEKYPCAVTTETKFIENGGESTNSGLYCIHNFTYYNGNK